MKRSYWFLLIFFIAAYILPLGVRPMIAPDEYRYAEIPREMIERGDYVVPYLSGARYFEKPALGYQWTAAMFNIFGVNRFALRLPPALAAGGAALLLLWLVRHTTRDDELAALSAGLFLTTGMVYGLGVFAVLDSQLNFFLTGTLVSYFLAIRTETMGKRKFFLLALSGVFAGLAFLTKGFLAFAVPGVVILPYLVWQKKWREIYTTPWIPMVFTAITAMPWSLAVHFREPDYWNYFFWIEHIQRMIKSDGGQHTEPVWFFIPVIIAGFLPVLFLLPAMLKGWKLCGRGILHNDLVRYLLCWTVFPFCFFSASSGKLATYILPCYVPMAALAAMGVKEYMHNAFGELFDKTLKYISMVLTAVAVIFSVWQISAPAAWCLYYDKEICKCIIAVCGMLLFSFILYRASVCEKRQYKLPMIAAGLAVMLGAGLCAVPERVIASKAHSATLEFMKEAAMPDKSIIAVNSSMMHSVSFNYHRTDIIVLFSGGELDYGLKYPDAKGRHLSMKELAELIKSTNRPPVVLITRKNRDSFLPEGTPAPDVKMDKNNIFLRRWN